MVVAVVVVVVVMMVVMVVYMMQRNTRVRDILYFNRSGGVVSLQTLSRSKPEH